MTEQVWSNMKKWPFTGFGDLHLADHRGFHEKMIKSIHHSFVAPHEDIGDGASICALAGYECSFFSLVSRERKPATTGPLTTKLVDEFTPRNWAELYSNLRLSVGNPL